jgi:adenylate cyclase
MDNLLGILLIGDAINAAVATELSGITGCHVTYIGPDRVYATSLGLEEQSVRDDLIRNTPKPDAKPQIWGNQLLMVQALNTGENSPGVVLVIKRSLDRFYANQYRVVAVSALIFLILIGLSLLLNAALSRRIVRPIRELTLAFTAVGRGDLSVQVKVDTGDEVQMLAETFSEMVIGLRERANVSRYLTGMEMDAVKSAVEKNTEVSQGGNKKIVSVLFSDIRSFTTMCEKCDPALVIESLNYYFNALIPIIEANGGSLDKLIGDCIMAVFEDSPGHNSADNAVKAAIEMQRKAKQIEVEMESKGYLKFLAGFGVNSGMAVVGNIGTADQMSRTVLGDSVNLAARIEALSKEGKHTGVLCSEYTVELLRGEWPLELLMETTVKGKTQPVKIYEVTKL